jgi:uncharacterized protein
MNWSKFNYLFEYKEGVFLLYNSLSNVLLEFDTEDYNNLLLLKKEPQLLKDHPSSDDLIENKIFVGSDDDEVNRIKTNILSRRYDNSHLHLIIAPTQSCNFNCNYCYENERHGDIMSEEVQMKIVEFIKGHESISNLQLTWYGGEPLIAFDEMNELVKKISKLEIPFISCMITNGYELTKEVINNLGKFNFEQIQITLDGNKNTHNNRRPHINGYGTYDKIIQNIDLLINSNLDIKLSIRVNIDKTNKKEYSEVLHYFNSKYPGNKNIFVYSGYIDKGEPSCESSDCITSNSEKVKFHQDLLKDNSYNLSVYPKTDFDSCMARSKNSYMIGPDGFLYKCLKNLGEKDKIIGNISNPENLDSLLMSKFLIKNDYLQSKICSNCFNFPLCSGGCALIRTGIIKDSGDKLCNYTKDNIEDYIRMHYENSMN